MFVQFFYHLKDAGLPVSLREYLTLMEAMDAEIITRKPEEFYFLARSTLVKSETNLDKFDQVFSYTFKGLESIDGSLEQEIPEEWLRKLAEKHLSEEEKALIKSLGGWENLMEELKKRLEEQQKRHQGGSKWIGTAGTSPFGAYGYNPEGIRIGQHESRHRRAVKVWDKREFKDLDDTIELGTRNIKVALKRLRQITRNESLEELDLDGTIKSTAHQGYLNLKMRPERHNAAKVLLFFDIGGSMDDHIKICEELFSAASTEFKHMEYFYFHNCLYESVWKNNQRRNTERQTTWEILNKYPQDYKVIFVGDASMSPYEITIPGGSVEHWNEESGITWMQRILENFEKTIWLNPVPEQYWNYTHSIQIIQDIVKNQMFPLTLEGLTNAMNTLSR